MYDNSLPSFFSQMFQSLFVRILNSGTAYSIFYTHATHHNMNCVSQSRSDVVPSYLIALLKVTFTSIVMLVIQIITHNLSTKSDAAWMMIV
jgi:hypothetical protein